MSVGRAPVWVVKIGGRLCEDDAMRAALATACAQSASAVVLVHGGGVMVSRLQAALGQTARFVDGRRVTDAGHMQAVEMALSGGINKMLVRSLLACGKRAVGLSGIDDSLAQCVLLPGLGAVGVPRRIRTDVLDLLIQNDMTPVLSPVSSGPSGEAVNVNADEFACQVAVALQAQRLLLLSDVAAVAVQGRDQAIVACDTVEDLIRQGEVHGGMVPKLRAAALAVKAGVEEVCIAGFVASLAQVKGTRVVGSRKAALMVAEEGET